MKRNKTKKSVKLTRKQLRKEQRKEKKVKRNEYYTNRPKPGQFVVNPDKTKTKNEGINDRKINRNKIGKSQETKPLSAEEARHKTRKEVIELQKKMNKQRKKQLLKANDEEDRTINRLKKLLKLNKQKNRSIPKSFASDGLDYLLEVCEPTTVGNAAAAEEQFHTTNDDFQEDFELMTGAVKDDNIHKETEIQNDGDSNVEDEVLDEEYSDDDLLSGSDNDSEGDNEGYNQNMKRAANNAQNQSKKVKFNDNIETMADDSVVDHDENDDDNNDEHSDPDDDILEDDEESEENIPKKNSDGTWEDIYGRLRSKDGSVLKSSESKYIPPAIRAQIENETSEDKQKLEKLNRLKKQIKGLLNRLAESNMHNVANQIENLYMNNSRNDMNSTITNLILEAIISQVITPERLLMEHVMLIAILHANVGTEVGAHFLQVVIKKFDELFKADESVENKSLDNVVNIIAQLYNFKLFDSKLVYEILEKLSNKFKEKDIECILHILRNIGFGLRKDDPIALKNLILSLQKQAANVKEENGDNARIKYLLDVLLAIKNNNVSKIPNYDTSYSEHLKKIIKGFVRKGNYVTHLNITLEDLLKADERGRWWVVGSAWSGNVPENNEKTEQKSNNFSQKLLELARKQRMNTDTRRSIFCIIMSSEDYLDAFEKLLRLGLKNQQEREIIHIILHCCLQEKRYNPYYAVLAQKFCEYDRKYQMTIKYSVWDKLKTLNEHSGCQIANLAKLLSHLFLEKGLSISVLKIVQFSELDKITLRFMRQILLGILLNNDLELCQGVFEKIAHSDKLKMFRESLRLFIHHFLLRNLKFGEIPVEQKELLESRATVVEQMLSKGEKAKFYNKNVDLFN